MLFKSIELKADEVGKVAGFFSTYDKEPDSYGDIIEPGAFTNTIEKRKATGHPFPLCFNHDFDKVIGRVESIEDKDVGPYIEATFLDTQLAQDVRTMLKSEAIYQFSFAYDVLKRRDPTEEEKKAGVMNVLQEIELFEVSIVTVPANQHAVVTEVKSVEPETKQGKRNSKADEDIIRDAIAQLGKCIESLESLIGEGEEDKPTEDEAPAEAEPEVNEASEEPKDDSNAKRAEAILSHIKSMKEVPDYDD